MKDVDAVIFLVASKSVPGAGLKMSSEDVLLVSPVLVKILPSSCGEVEGDRLSL